MFKTKTFSTLAAAAVYAALAAAMSAPASAQTKTAISTKYCAATVENELQKLGVSRDSVEEVTYVEQHFIGRNAPSSLSKGVSAWVHLKSCSGQVVLEMGPNCSVYSRYTKGQCQVSGLASY